MGLQDRSLPGPMFRGLLMLMRRWHVLMLLHRLAFAFSLHEPPILRCGRNLAEDHGTECAVCSNHWPDGPRKEPSSNASHVEHRVRVR